MRADTAETGSDIMFDWVDTEVINTDQSLANEEHVTQLWKVKVSTKKLIYMLTPWLVEISTNQRV